jgi:hypothetical protein
MSKALLKKGKTLLYEVADFDASDTYGFRLDEVGDELTFTAGFTDIDDDSWRPEATITCTAAALASGPGLLRMSQGSAEGGDDFKSEGSFDGYAPPFLLPRAIAEQLCQGKAAQLDFGGQTWKLAPGDAEERTLFEDGPTVQVRTAEGDDITLVFVDDPAQPLIVDLTYEGDNYVRLLGAR